MEQGKLVYIISGRSMMSLSILGGSLWFGKYASATLEPEIGVPWPMKEGVVLSEKDKNAHLSKKQKQTLSTESFKG